MTTADPRLTAPPSSQSSADAAAILRPYQAPTGPALKPWRNTDSTTVHVTTRTSASVAGWAGPSVVDRDEQEDDRGQAARPEPADQRHGVGSKTGTDERDGDRDHPHDVRLRSA